MGDRGAATWRLFTDWCRAVDVDPHQGGEEALGRFFAQVRCADSTRAERERLLRRRLGVTDPGPGPVLCGEDVREALPAIPWHGWPGGYRGRRDAWLLVLLATVPGSLEDLVVFTPDRVEFTGGGWLLAGHRVGRGSDPRSCSGCAVARWLEVVAVGSHWSRAAVKGLLCGPVGSGHVCSGPVAGRWREAWTLAPAIDRHGWAVWWRSMSVRALREVCGSRVGVRGPVFEPEVSGAGRRVTAARGEDEVFADLDEVVARAAAVNQRVEDALRSYRPSLPRT